MKIGRGKRKPVVRAGQKKPYIKATTAQIEERIDFVADLLVRHKKKHEIRKAVRRKFGRQLHNVTIDSIYMLRAKHLLMKQAGMSKQDAKGIAINTVVDVIANGNNMERLAGVRLLCDISGNYAPKQTQISGPDGGPIQSESTFRIEKPLSREAGLRMLEILEHGTKIIARNGKEDRKMLTGPEKSNGESHTA